MDTNPAFEDVIGHKAAKMALTRALERPQNGYLILGLDGIGGHALAERFVRALQAHPADRPLDVHPDIAVLRRELSDSGKSLKKEIAVKAVRELRARIYERPSVAARVVIYIPEADYLNEEGVNALLKSVEEPPAGAVFVCVAHQASKLPATLQSRLVRIALQRVPSNDIDAWLRAEGIRDDVRARAIAIAEGRPGIAYRYAHDPLFVEDVEKAEQVIRLLMAANSEGDAFAAIAETASACDAAEDPVTEWRKTLQLWSAALRRHVSEHPERACGIGHAFLAAERAMGGPVSPRIFIELGLVRVASGRAPVFPGLLPSTYPYPIDA